MTRCVFFTVGIFLASLTNAIGSPPQCNDICSSWDPCSKVCFEGTAPTTCGNAGAACRPEDPGSGPSCGELGGDHCSQESGCPGGFDFLGASNDCRACCQSVEAPPPPAGPVDDAIVVDSDLPDRLYCGEDFAASVTMRNTGTDPWTPGLFSLGAVGDGDLFGGPERIALPADGDVPPGGEHRFDLVLSGPYGGLQGGPTKWRMVHDGVAWFGSFASAWVDVECGCEAGSCAAGCAHVPAFSASSTRVGIGMPVTFEVAEPDTILDELPNWDFGDETHCEHCPRTVTHTYSKPGVYRVRLTATESRCGAVVVSRPVLIEVFDRAVPRHRAEVIGMDLPTGVCGGIYPASVTVKNTGREKWVPGQFFLGAVGDFDPFSDANRIPLEKEVFPQDVYSFDFELRAPTAGCPFTPCRTEWQMVWEDHYWFGGKAREDVDVELACPPIEEGDYLCRATAHDEYGEPLSSKTVVLETFIYGDTKWEVVDRAFSVTDELGRATVSMDIAEPATRLRCLVDLRAKGRNIAGYVIDQAGIPSGTEVEVAAVAIPKPTHSVGAIGLEGASAVAHLYQSGAYDRVVVIPEPFSSNELVDGARGREGLWDELRAFMQPLYDLGLDVWVVNPPATGQNIHEQSAELAQVIEYAARRHSSDPAFDGEVALAGISLGGVVSRIATARWESSASEDATWRRRLGLGDRLPVKLIAFVDSPLRGANVPESLQRFLWRPYGVGPSKAREINMSSCAFHQMVIRQAYEPPGCPPTLDGKSCNWEAFYAEGRKVGFPGGGTCDSSANGICWCDAGPAVFSINGDGFAHGPRIIAYSDGKHGESLQCYGDDRDNDREGNNLCGSRPRPRILRPGDEWLQLEANNFSDRHFLLEDSDLVAGSRMPTTFDGRRFDAPNLGFPVLDKITAHQFSSPTFIPFSSAWATDGAVCVFSDCRQNDFNGSHVNPSVASSKWLLEEIGGGWGAAEPTPLQDLRVDGPYSAEMGQIVAMTATLGNTEARVSWDLGDGTVREGTSIAHSYQRAGIYSVRVTTQDPEGVVTTSARIGLAQNRPPRIGNLANVVAQPFEPVDLSAVVSESETELARTSWSFGDGERGEGLQITHSWTEPGTYRVTFSATDDEGASSTADLFASVGTPPAPEVMAPIMEEVGLFPAFTWRPIDGATSYGVRVIHESEMDSRQVTVDASDSCSGSVCLVALDQALVEGDFFWSVTATNDSGEGPPSDWAPFHVQTALNNLPSVAVDASGGCTANGCRVSFEASASDPDGDGLSYSWSGCASGSSRGVTCGTGSSGELTAAVSVRDPYGGRSTASAAVTIHALGYQLGDWGSCVASEPFLCSGSGEMGCSRPGTQTRSVSEVAWTLNVAEAMLAPPSSQVCVEKAPGFVAGYSVGVWGACSAACFSGTRTRIVEADRWKAQAPDALRPADTEVCNPGQSCNRVCFPSFQLCNQYCGGVCERRINCGGATAHKCFE